MARDRSSPDRRDAVRESLAHVAARIMAQDGIDDFGVAKRKAARQAGVSDTRGLPTNEEVELALRQYQQIYQGAEQSARLEELRREAVAVMRRFSRFQPHLTGSVLSGLAGKYSGVSLQLFVDNAKEVELFLLNEGIPYRTGEARLVVGDQEKVVPTYALDGETADVRLVLLSTDDQRCPVRSAPGGRAIDRATLSAVETLVSGSRI
jgi:hypothetical protein